MAFDVSKLDGLNTARLGSFGEFVFANTAARTLGGTVKREHDNNTDFITVNGDRIDVKSTNLVRKAPLRLEPYHGSRAPGVNYAKVEFHKGGARVSLEGRELEDVSLRALETIWSEWMLGRARELPKSDKSQKRAKLRPIIAEIKEFFQSHGINPRVIYRTCEISFGKESPGNLVLKKPKPDGLTVYVSFFNADISRDNLYRLIAFTDKSAKTFPLLNEPHLNLPKVDLDQLPNQYSFKTIDELKNEYFKRFPSTTRDENNG